MENCTPVRKHYHDVLEYPKMTVFAAEDRQEEAASAVQSDQEEAEPAGVTWPAFSSAAPSPVETSSEDGTFEDSSRPESPKPEASSTCLNTTEKPQVRFPPTQDVPIEVVLQPSSPRCSSHTCLSIRPTCQACAFMATLANTGKALSAWFAIDAAELERRADFPNHAQTVYPTDHGIPDFDDPTNSNVEDALPWLRGFLRPTVFKFPDSAEADRLLRMAKLKEAVAQRRKTEATQSVEDRQLWESEQFERILQRRERRGF